MEYTLVGVDSNSFSLLGYVSKAMIKEGLSKEEVAMYREDAMSGGYSHLLVVSMEVINKLNE